MVLFAWPYRQTPLQPFWGEINSQANFCEEDYIVTQYIAELINTITNLTYVFYAVHGIRKNSGRPDAFLRNLPYLGIMGVGLGSVIFHASLKNYTQWCDDLSMLLATATVLHRVYTFDSSVSVTVGWGVALSAALSAFSYWHCVTDEIVMHSIIFGIMICLVGIQTRSIIAHRIEDPEVKKEVTKLCTWGGVIFVSGYGIWNLDNAFCSLLTDTKRNMGMPWSFILELHGWWHIFTGVGAYIFIALVEYLTSDEAGQHLEGRFAWPVGLIVNCGAGAKKHANGDLNGFATGSTALLSENGLSNGNGNGNVNGNGNGKATNGYATHCHVNGKKGL